MKNLISLNASVLLTALVSLSACQQDDSGMPAETAKQEVACMEGKFYDAGFNGVIGGSRVRSDSWIARKTVWLFESEGESACTATLIDRDVILTAAHCVETAKSAETIMAVFSTQPACDLQSGKLISKSVVAESFQIHKAYGDADHELRGDIALIKLESDAPSSAEVVELKTSPAPMADFDRVLVAGFGRTTGGTGVERAPIALRALVRTPLQGDSLSSVKRRLHKALQPDQPFWMVSLALDSYFDPSVDAELMWLDQTDRKGVCSGDSGGPAYVIEEGRVKHIGVTSTVMQDSAENTCLMISAYTNVRKYKDWIGETYTELTGRPASRIFQK